MGWPELEGSSERMEKVGPPVQWSIPTDSEQYIDSLGELGCTNRGGRKGADVGGGLAEKRLGRLKEQRGKTAKRKDYGALNGGGYSYSPSSSSPLNPHLDDADQEEQDGATGQDGTGNDGNTGSRGSPYYDTGDKAEEDIIDDSENACLLYNPALPAGHAEVRYQRAVSAPPPLSRGHSNRSESMEDNDDEASPDGELARNDLHDEFSADDRRGRRAGTPLANTTNGQREVSPSPVSAAIARMSDASGILPANIRFSDTVRICGGIRSSGAFHAHDAGSLRRSRSVSSTGGVSHHHHHQHQQTAPSTTSTAPSSANNSSISIFSPTPVTPSRVPGLPVTFSRPASFVSDDGLLSGRSRASTPASLYAPLLNDSKSAPSPSRTFYLTFKRDDGSVTYRELVKRQQQHYNTKRGSKRWRKGSEGSSKDRSCLSSWASLAFWRCGDDDDDPDGGGGDEAEGDLESGRGVSSRHHEDDEGEGDDESGRHGRTAHKSEMEVLFGGAPWRWLRLEYWTYRCSRLCGSLSGYSYEEV